MPIMFNQCVALQVDPITSTFARSIVSSSQCCLFHSSQATFVFPAPPTLFLQGLGYLNQVSILWIWCLSILFRQCPYPVILRKILTKPQVHHSSFFSFSGGFHSSFGIEHSLFVLPNAFLMPVHLIIIPRLLFNCSGVLKISRRFVFSTLHSFKILRGYSLIQAIWFNWCYLFSKWPFQRCNFWVGPNPQVFFQDLTWLFLFSRSYPQISFRSLT